MYSLIGHPIGHSMSPFIHKRLFELSGKAESYSLCDIDPDNFTAEFKAAIDNNSGLNVTIPYKPTVIEQLDGLDDSAARYNAVNCIAKKDGKTIGYNTDCVGFLRSVPEEGLAGKFLLAGCGGVGRMMAIESAAHGGDITIAIREADGDMAKALEDEIKGKYPATSVRIVLLSEIEGKFDLLSNSTPVGMYPNTDVCPVPDSAIENSGFVFDAIYNPKETLLIKKARAMGKAAAGGMSMLVLQAVAAHEIWYGADFRKEDIDKLIEDSYVEMEKIFGKA